MKLHYKQFLDDFVKNQAANGGEVCKEPVEQGVLRERCRERVRPGHPTDEDFSFFPFFDDVVSAEVAARNFARVNPAEYATSADPFLRPMFDLNRPRMTQPCAAGNYMHAQDLAWGVVGCRPGRRLCALQPTLALEARWAQVPWVWEL